MAHNLYSGFAIQNTFMSTVVLINEVSEVFQRHYLPKCYSANVPLDFCTTADFDIKYFFERRHCWGFGQYLTDFLSFAAKMTISTQN